MYDVRFVSSRGVFDACEFLSVILNDDVSGRVACVCF